MPQPGDACIFCQIIEGSIPSLSVFNNEHFFAFLDINPVQPGHTLLIPKRHVATLFDVDPLLDADWLAQVVPLMGKLGRAVMQAAGAQGLNVMQNNYRAAGQQVDHLHWHLIPRHEGDGLRHWPQGKYGDSAMQHMGEVIRKNMEKEIARN